MSCMLHSAFITSLQQSILIKDYSYQGAYSMTSMYSFSGVDNRSMWQARDSAFPHEHSKQPPSGDPL